MHKDDVLAFLEKIDAHVGKNLQGPSKEKFPLRIIGKSALLLADFKDDVGTVDLDALAIESSASNTEYKKTAEDLLKNFGRSQQKVHGYYLEFVSEAIVFIRNPKWISLETPKKHIFVEYLECHDVIVSKCFSAFSATPRRKDKTDIVTALDQGLLDPKELLKKIDKIFDFYSMDSRSDRFEEVYQFVQDNIIATYGGRLNYIPSDH